MKRCHQCKAPWVSEKKQPGPKEFCDSCGAYLHCCLNCSHYDPAKHNQCAIGTTDWVGDKAGLNFCDEFEFAEEGAKGQDRKDGDRSGFDALFGGETPDEKPKTGRDGLDQLFGD